MFRVVGIDLGHTEKRAVSLGMLWGAPRKEEATSIDGNSIVALSSDQLTFRTLNVPDTGREIQRNIIREELISSLPFPVDDTSWDWIVNEDIATVAVALEENISQIRTQISEEATIDAEPLSYLRVLKSLKIEEALIFDFGASKTTICAVKNGLLDWVRVSFRGGQSLTREISKNGEIGEEEAENLKISQGIEQPECRQWLNDIVDSCLLSKPVSFEKVFICGRGAKMEGLSLELSTILGQTAEPFPLPGGLDPYTDVTAYGTALAGKAGMPKLSLEEKKPDVFTVPWKYAIWLLVILALATTNLEFRHYSADRSLHSQVNIYQQAVKAALPSLAKEQPESYQSELENRTNTNIENTRRSPEFLLEIIARLAKPLSHYPDLEIRTLSMNAEAEDPVITIGGQSRSVQQTEEFRQSIGDVVNSAEFLENRKGRDNITTFSIEGKLPKP